MWILLYVGCSAKVPPHLALDTPASPSPPAEPLPACRMTLPSDELEVQDDVVLAGGLYFDIASAPGRDLLVQQLQRCALSDAERAFQAWHDAVDAVAEVREPVDLVPIAAEVAAGAGRTFADQPVELGAPAWSRTDAPTPAEERAEELRVAFIETLSAAEAPP